MSEMKAGHQEERAGILRQRMKLLSTEFFLMEAFAFSQFQLIESCPPRLSKIISLLKVNWLWISNSSTKKASQQHLA